jgi:hypothetical protein
MSLGSNGGGSGAFVAKNSDATLFYELVHHWHLFVLFRTTVRGVTQCSETPKNMSLGSNGVDRVRKFPMRVHSNLCINGTSWARFAPKFV